jgi:hypothetical protein
MSIGIPGAIDSIVAFDASDVALARCARRIIVRSTFPNANESTDPQRCFAVGSVV